MTIILIGTLFFVGFLILGLLLIFSSEEEPEWNREEILLIPKKEFLPVAQEEVTETTEVNNAAQQIQPAPVYQPKVLQVDGRAIESERVA